MDRPSRNPGLVADCTALVAVRNHFMSNPANARLDWASPWKGTTISGGRVVYLDLERNQLTGPIPTQLANLTNLRSLNLDRNQLTGPIPTQLANLTNLRSLDLDRNQLTGTIPPELGELTNLEWLRLDRNQLTGTIPTQLGRLTNLRSLDLRGNQLTGTIPTQLANLTNLTGLLLGGNQLTGTIPIELASLTNLTALFLAHNQLTGPIPTQLGRLTNLTGLGLGYNQLTGTIPTQLANLTNLTGLGLEGNQLTGTIPIELADLTNLTWLYLNDNQLTGTISIQLANLTNLAALLLSGNRLTGPIPPQLANLTSLERLYLNDNRLTGPIPPQLANLTNLTWLLLGGNQLTGEISTSLKVSQAFQFCPNRLTGVLPSHLRSVAPSFTGDPDDIGPSCSTGTFEGTFSDDEGNVHENNIEQIAQWGITTGCDKRRFCPSRTVNRAQMSAFLYRAVTHLSGTPDPGEEIQLSDVPDDAWYQTNAQWAVNNGVIRALEGAFNPSGDVTRSDMAEMLVAAFDHLSAPAQPQGLFSDTTGLPDTAIRAIEGIHAAGVTAGCATDPLRYCPAETVTRAQMASFLTRAIQAADMGS